MQRFSPSFAFQASEFFIWNTPMIRTLLAANHKGSSMSMRMKLRNVIGVFVLTSLVAASLLGQKAELPRSTDFDISPGRSFSASTGKPKTPVKQPVLYSSVLTDVSEAMSVIARNHAGGSKLKIEKLAESSLKEMLRVLDPHSRFYAPSEYSDLAGEHNSEFLGTGMTIAEYGTGEAFGVYIIGVTPGTAAADKGLRFGDKIVSVNGRSVKDLTATGVRELIRGPQGTSVTVEVERVGSTAKKSVSLRRERISQSSIGETMMLPDNVGYIGLTRGFGFTTAAEFGSAMADLKGKGMRSLIIDLRGNGGGIFASAVEIAEYFLPAGSVIVSQSGRNPRDTQTWRSANRLPEQMPVVVLVDGNTASASEILAGALQDNDRALIIGERTFGKGLVQNVYDLDGGSGIALTAARYYTPAGRSIQRDYTDVGLYDYFNHTDKADLIDRSANAVTTLTNRTVYGGNGIAPDVNVAAQHFDKVSFAIFDAAFYFVRDRFHGGSEAQVEEMRRRILFGEEIADDVSVADLGQYAKEKAGIDVLTTDAKRLVEIRQQLRYNIALAVMGVEYAEKVQIANDPNISAATENMPRAMQLAKAADLARAEKNARRVTSPTGTIGRNRRTWKE
jgi:carboxyl-terminal processing protease